MVLSSIYNWLFAADLLLFKPGDNQEPVVLRVGDNVSVHSERFSCWFSDGIITATFRDRIKVSYGFKKFFGWTLKRGNEKTVMMKDIKEKVRPHKLYQIDDASGSLRLVAAAVKSGKLDPQTVAIKKTV